MASGDAPSVPLQAKVSEEAEVTKEEASKDGEADDRGVEDVKVPTTAPRSDGETISSSSEQASLSQLHLRLGEKETESEPPPPVQSEPTDGLTRTASHDGEGVDNEGTKLESRASSGSNTKLRSDGNGLKNNLQSSDADRPVLHRETAELSTLPTTDVLQDPPAVDTQGPTSIPVASRNGDQEKETPTNTEKENVSNDAEKNTSNDKLSKEREDDTNSDKLSEAEKLQGEEGKESITKESENQEDVGTVDIIPSEEEKNKQIMNTTEKDNMPVKDTEGKDHKGEDVNQEKDKMVTINKNVNEKENTPVEKSGKQNDKDKAVSVGKRVDGLGKQRKDIKKEAMKSKKESKGNVQNGRQTDKKHTGGVFGVDKQEEHPPDDDHWEHGSEGASALDDDYQPTLEDLQSLEVVGVPVKALSSDMEIVGLAARLWPADEELDMAGAYRQVHEEVYDDDDDLGGGEDESFGKLTDKARKEVSSDEEEGSGSSGKGHRHLPVPPPVPARLSAHSRRPPPASSVTSTPSSSASRRPRSPLTKPPPIPPRQRQVSAKNTNLTTIVQPDFVQSRPETSTNNPPAGKPEIPKDKTTPSDPVKDPDTKHDAPKDVGLTVAPGKDVPEPAKTNSDHLKTTSDKDEVKTEPSVPTSDAKVSLITSGASPPHKDTKTESEIQKSENDIVDRKKEILQRTNEKHADEIERRLAAATKQREKELRENKKRGGILKDSNSSQTGRDIQNVSYVHALYIHSFWSHACFCWFLPGRCYPSVPSSRSRQRRGCQGTAESAWGTPSHHAPTGRDTSPISYPKEMCYIKVKCAFNNLTRKSNSYDNRLMVIMF